MQASEPEITVQIGQVNTLEVLRKTEDGFVLKGSGKAGISLAKSQAPNTCRTGQKLDVFLYPEKDGKIEAACTMPKAQVGECVLLKAINVIKAGAFMDWGGGRDLLVPVSQQAIPMAEGRTYVVYLLLDPQQQIIGSSKLHRFLDETAGDMTPGTRVDLLIVGKTDLGYKAVINGTHLGLLFRNEVLQALRPGDRTPGYIKSIREDGKINLSLQLHDNKTRAELGERILAYLKSNQGISTLTDYSPPEAIYKQYGVSKGSYKKALGVLYKQRRISLSKNRVSLVARSSEKSPRK